MMMMILCHLQWPSTTRRTRYDINSLMCQTHETVETPEKRINCGTDVILPKRLPDIVFPNTISTINHRNRANDPPTKQQQQQRRQQSRPSDEQLAASFDWRESSGLIRVSMYVEPATRSNPPVFVRDNNAKSITSRMMNVVNEDSRQEAIAKVIDEYGNAKFKRIILSVVPQKQNTEPSLYSGPVESLAHLAYRSFGITSFFPLLALDISSYMALTEFGHKMFEKVKGRQVNLAGMFEEIAIPQENFQLQVKAEATAKTYDDRTGNVRETCFVLDKLKESMNEYSLFGPNKTPLCPLDMRHGQTTELTSSAPTQTATQNTAYTPSETLDSVGVVVVDPQVIGVISYVMHNGKEALLTCAHVVTQALQANANTASAEFYTSDGTIAVKLKSLSFDVNNVSDTAIAYIVLNGLLPLNVESAPPVGQTITGILVWYTFPDRCARTFSSIHLTRDRAAIQQNVQGMSGAPIVVNMSVLALNFGTIVDEQKLDRTVVWTYCDSGKFVKQAVTKSVKLTAAQLKRRCTFVSAVFVMAAFFNTTQAVYLACSVDPAAYALYDTYPHHSYNCTVVPHWCRINSASNYNYLVRKHQEYVSLKTFNISHTSAQRAQRSQLLVQKSEQFRRLFRVRTSICTRASGSFTRPSMENVPSPDTYFYHVDGGNYIFETPFARQNEQRSSSTSEPLLSRSYRHNQQPEAFNIRHNANLSMVLNSYTAYYHNPGASRLVFVVPHGIEVRCHRSRALLWTLHRKVLLLDHNGQVTECDCCQNYVLSLFGNYNITVPTCRLEAFAGQAVFICSRFGNIYALNQQNNDRYHLGTLDPVFKFGDTYIEHGQTVFPICHNQSHQVSTNYAQVKALKLDTAADCKMQFLTYIISHTNEPHLTDANDDIFLYNVTDEAAYALYSMNQTFNRTHTHYCRYYLTTHVACEDPTQYDVKVLDDGRVNITYTSDFNVKKIKVRYKRDTEFVEHMCDADKCIMDFGDDYSLIVAQVGNDGTEKHIRYVRNDMSFLQRWLHDAPFLRGVLIASAVIMSLIAICVFSCFIKRIREFYKIILCCFKCCKKAVSPTVTYKHHTDDSVEMSTVTKPTPQETNDRSSRATTPVSSRLPSQTAMSTIALIIAFIIPLALKRLQCYNT